jgi:TolB protein
VNEDPVWSPDGSRIAFSSVRRSKFRICIMNANGDNLHCLIGPDMRGMQPAWSWDGTKIAFISDDRVCVMDANGDHVRCLTDPSMRAWYPVWSPSGSQLAFLSRGNQMTAFYIVDVDGSNLRHLINGFPSGYVSRPIAWAPDGQRIAVRTDQGLSIINTNGDSLGSVHPRGGGCPTWSRDGTEIVICSITCSAVSVATGEEHSLTSAPSEREISYPDGCSALSPDRTLVAFSTFTKKSGDYEIYIMNANGSNPRQLTHYSVWDRMLGRIPLLPFIDK